MLDYHLVLRIPRRHACAALSGVVVSVQCRVSGRHAPPANGRGTVTTFAGGPVSPERGMPGRPDCPELPGRRRPPPRVHLSRLARAIRPKPRSASPESLLTER